MKENKGKRISVSKLQKRNLDELESYRAIGTVNEFKSLKEDWLNKFDSLIEYRKIGTPDELKQLKENGAFTGVELAQLAAMQMKLKEYQAIGTVEEFRTAVEKQKEKKPIIKYKGTHDCVTEVEWKCPICGTNYIELKPCGEWCRYCGQKLDWSDEE